MSDQVLYVIVNIAVGGNVHKMAIMSSQTLLEGLLNHMVSLTNIKYHRSAAVRVATIWCIINLTWMEDEGAQLRITKLQQLDMSKRLEYLIQQDENVDVRDRAKTALLNLNGGFPVNDHDMNDIAS